MSIVATDDGPRAFQMIFARDGTGGVRLGPKAAVGFSNNELPRTREKHATVNGAIAIVD
jgi:hypothetical protein